MEHKIVFFGTGPVSLHCLEGIQDDFSIEAIITKPDRTSPSGKAHPHPVRTWGEAHNIPVIQVADKQELARLVAKQEFESRIGLVVDFGLIIPQETIDSFEFGIVNSHFSLLPALRGADPISFAILEGRAKTGVSLMTIVPELDEGDLLSQESLILRPGITTPELTELLGDLSNELLRRDIPRYINHDITPTPQSEKDISYTRKLMKVDGILDRNKTAEQLEREIRAFIGWPGSRTELFGVDIIITGAHVATGEEDGLMLACGDDTHLAIDTLKPAGKREMSGADFERGYSAR